MVKLKNKILKTIGNNKDVENTLNELSVYQNNIIKNYNNPVFSNEDKNKLLNFYSNIEDLGKSLYRYNILKQNNITKEAEIEKGNIENLLLKGYISNKKYVWHSEMGEHTCEVCADLDGQEFDSYEEVPQRPHPNCKCTVEIVESASAKGGDSEPSKDDEPCDLIEDIDTLIGELEETQQSINALIEDAQSDLQDLENDLNRVQNLINDADETLIALSEEYGKHLPGCENNVDKDYAYMYEKRDILVNLSKDIQNLFSPYRNFIETCNIFISNYLELLYHAYMLKEFEMDKYYHSKANCEATQKMGMLGNLYATILSDSKEWYDQYTYVHTHKVSVEEAIADSERDQVANRLGRERGRKYPNCDCSILMSDLKPKYKK